NKADVEAEINERFKTLEPPAASFGGPTSGIGAQSQARPAGASSMGGDSSFLDEWLAKRRTAMQAQPGKQPDLSNAKIKKRSDIIMDNDQTEPTKDPKTNDSKDEENQAQTDSSSASVAKPDKTEESELPEPNKKSSEDTGQENPVLTANADTAPEPEQAEEPPRPTEKTQDVADAPQEPKPAEKAAPPLDALDSGEIVVDEDGNVTRK
ncbi:MAG: hypothetical protein WDZ81_00590, partial [Candidatus Saccharimonadales bacterium]